MTIGGSQRRQKRIKFSQNSRAGRSTRCCQSSSCLGERLTFGAIIEQPIDLNRQIGRRTDRQSRLLGCKCFGLFKEVLHVGPVQNGASQASRLHQVMTAMRNKRSSDECNRNGAKEKTEFPERVDEEDVCITRRVTADSPAGDTKPHRL